MNELDVTRDVTWAVSAPGELTIRDAIGLARDQGQLTWLTDDGEPVAAVVPVGMAMLGGALESPARPGYGSKVRDRICAGCARPENEPHEDWCPVVTGTLSSLPREQDRP